MGAYEDAKRKYGWTPMLEKWAEGITRMQDFDLLDYEVEENGDKPDAEQVEEILTAFNQALCEDDCYYYTRVGHMRDAIRGVMGDGYLDR